MRDIDMMIDLLEAQYNGMNRDVAELEETAVHWQSDPAANSIAITIWHLGRVADFVLSHRIEGQEPDKQRWFSNSWSEKSSYFWCRVILIDATRHLGEIQAIKAMWQRQQ